MNTGDPTPQDRTPQDRSDERRDPAGHRAAPASARPDDLAAGVEPMAEVPGGPQVDVPAA